jgi:hypothetical protein
MAAANLEWLKVLGPILLAAVVGIATWKFQQWQVRLAKQKLGHELYGRRMAIYVAFRELLMALPEKGDEEIKTLFRNANIARFEARRSSEEQSSSRQRVHGKRITPWRGQTQSS